MSRPRPTGETGLTLIEMLVVLALTGLVSLLMLQGVGLASRGLDRLSRQSDRLEARRGLEIALRRALATAVALPVLDGKPGFAGTPDSVSFISAIDNGDPGLHRIRLWLDRGRKEPAVMLSRSLAGSFILPHRSDDVLLRGVRAFRLSYFGAPSPDATPGWRQQWQGMAILPELLRIEVGTSDRRPHPPIVIRVRDAD